MRVQLGHSRRIRVIRRRLSRSQHSPIISTRISHPSSASAIRPRRPDPHPRHLGRLAASTALAGPGQLNSRAAAGQAGGFLPGVPLGCLGMTGPRSRLRPRPLRQRMRDESLGRVKLVGQPHAGIQRRPQRRRSELWQLDNWPSGQAKP